MEERPDAVDLYWLPLGAGGHSVRLNGKLFEAVAAGLDRRPRLALYHSALVVRADGERFVVEQAPAGREGERRGVVSEGPVGWSRLRRLRLVRYELRCWRDGVIPDLAEAVESPRRLTNEAVVARRVLELAPSVPALTWGRDEAVAGEMWTSNSAISWLLAGSGVDVDDVRLPVGGRAPGWEAGIVVARRSAVAEDDAVRQAAVAVPAEVASLDPS